MATMWFGLFLIFVAVPLLELALLIKVGQWIGFWPTLAIVIGTAGAGVAVMQSHGVRVMQQAMTSLAEGRPPVQPVVDGTFIMFAGLLLISPGIMTDIAGLLLLIPPVRRVVGRWSISRLLASGSVHTWSTTEGRRGWPGETAPRSEPRPGGQTEVRDAAAEPAAKRWNPKPRTRPPSGGQVIDGEFERIDEKPVEPKKPQEGR
jgi:UPF0716 protein FxsA